MQQMIIWACPSWDRCVCLMYVPLPVPRGERHPQGVLILRRTLRHAIWVIILEQRQYSGTYTHAFFM